MTTFWERAAHSVNPYVLFVVRLFVILVVWFRGYDVGSYCTSSLLNFYFLFLEKKYFETFTIYGYIWVCLRSCSCDPDIRSSTHPWILNTCYLAVICQADWEKMIENNGHMLYTEADNPLGPILNKDKPSITLVI